MSIDTGSPVIIMLQQVNKQVQGKLGILSSIRDHGKKIIETRKAAYTCRYTSGHSIPKSFMQGIV